MEDGQDNLLNAEHYVMLGTYDRDRDRFQTMREIAAQFLKSLEWCLTWTIRWWMAS